MSSSTLNLQAVILHTFVLTSSDLSTTLLMLIIDNFHLWEDVMNLRLIFMLVLVGFVVLFILQNIVVVEISFLFWSIEMSRSLLMFLLLSVGVIIGWFLHGYFGHRKSKS